ncbi:MAG TPA: xylan 1,4-beta-xylosidase [Streptomyces sp.]|uniref:GH39 family glycosyl hydrolase n=1 Tax=Streptomyces sp. TaxID=1931 RepID=UPI002C865654|nr:xylan 1,4-beta-xylosidase [Streptomyces sp.]HWU06310.1 xylan 1,4-beta-xylosidase [Streptomyces sp.]
MYRQDGLEGASTTPAVDGPVLAIRPPAVEGKLGRASSRTRWFDWEVSLWMAVVCMLLTAFGSSPAGLSGTLRHPLPGLAVGATHTQYSIDSSTPAQSAARALEVIREVAPVQNQHLMGWGAMNPEPSPGHYDFSSLDRRMELITEAGAEAVLTLCCAPDWMKGEPAGTTDWSRIEAAPRREHFDDFAELAQVAAQRYAHVHRFVVWNELKGFYDSGSNHWDAAAYTDLYNRVYTAIKQVRPDALVGGPYVIVDSWASEWAGGHRSTLKGPWGTVDQRSLDVLRYWLDHAVGADFVALDGGTHTHDRGLITTDFVATAKLSTVTEWVRARTDLPIWWVELGAETGDESAPAADPRRAAVMVHALVTVAHAGASGALLWRPREDPDRTSVALFSDTSSPSGGKPLPLSTLLAMVGRQLQEDPRQVLSTWYPSASLWTLVTPGGSAMWSPDTGLRIVEE